MDTRRKSQKQLVKEYLLDGGIITPLDALREYGCFRLSAIIFVLRQEGMDIKTRTSEGKKKYAIYSLVI